MAKDEVAVDEEAPLELCNGTRTPSEQWVLRETLIAIEGTLEVTNSEDNASGEDADNPLSSEAVVVVATTSPVVSRGRGGMDWIGRCTLIMTILIIAGSIGLCVMLIPSSKSKSNSTNSAGTGHAVPLSPTQYYDLLYHHLLNVRQVQDLRDPSTPTYEALEWMAFQDGTVIQLLVPRDDDDDDEQQQGQLQWQLDVRRMEQRFSLAVFFFATAGADFWDSEWLQIGTHECEFDGITCRKDDRSSGANNNSNTNSKKNSRLVVTALKLPQRSLLGAIPQELAWLSHLEILDLYVNRLYGTLPEALFQDLTKLRYIDLGFNELTGTLPNDWSSLTRLQDVTAEGNMLTGPLPKALPLLSLEYLSLNLNPLTGTIPLTEWNAQARLYDELSLLNRNSSEGASSDQNMTRGSVALKILELGETKVGGTFPSLIGSTLSHLVSVGLYQTQIHGTIPSQVGQLVKLEEFSLGSTQLTGPMPTEIWKLSNLQWLVLTATDVSGTFPPEVSNLSSLKVLNMVDTKWSGTLPTELGTLSHLEWLQLSSTAITGSIPSQLGQLSKLSKST